MEKREGREKERTRTRMVMKVDKIKGVGVKTGWDNVYFRVVESKRCLFRIDYAN